MAAGLLGDWFLVCVVGAVLYGFWRLLAFTFDMIEKAQAARSLEDSSSNKGTGL